MSRPVRSGVFAASALGLVALLAWGFAGLPALGDFGGHYGQLVAQIAVPERKASSVVATTVFDFRAIDTLVEELILFTATLGVLVLLRLGRRESEIEADPAEGQPVTGSDTVRAVAAALVGPVLVLGMYLVTHGHLTPGGGFQGGLVLTRALLLVYLAGTKLHLGEAEPMDALDLAHGLGAAGFALIGLGGLLFAGAYFENFLDLGTFARLWSGGTIPVSNVIVGLEVVGATLAIFSELLDRRLLSQGGGE